MNDLECRFNTPGAIEARTSRFDGEYNNFEERDEEAWEIMDALIRRAKTQGLPADENAELADKSASGCTYRVPIGKRALKHLGRGTTAIPWLGELRVDAGDTVFGDGPCWRAYFTDLRHETTPGNERDEVLMASVRLKGENGYKRKEQDKHIRDAVDAARRWCRDNPPFICREAHR